MAREGGPAAPDGPTVRVHAIVVAFDPMIERLHALCEALSRGGARVLVVDNSEPSKLDGLGTVLNASVIALNTNTGIAHAQNVGAEAALASGAEILIFFDQDSQVEPALVQTLAASLDSHKAQVVAPVAVSEDDRTEELPAEVLMKWGFRHAARGLGSTGPVRVDVVISSGTAVTRPAFERVGPFDESLFVDFVDTEWCLRAKSRAVPIHLIPQAVMVHRIGARTIRVGRRRLLVHSPLRCYYQIRNALLLFRAPHAPKIYAMGQFKSVMLSRLALLLVVNQRTAYLTGYLRAIRDGLLGRRGKSVAVP